MIARNRSHLAALLEGQLRRVPRDGTREARRNGEAVPVKTYLMEGRGPVPPKPVTSGVRSSRWQRW